MMGHTVLTQISLYALPIIILAILGVGLLRNVRAFDAFAEGAVEGVGTVIKILPPLVGIMTAVGVFRASGALDFIVWLLKPAVSLLGIPAEAMPLALHQARFRERIVALVSDTIREYGPDSYIGRVVVR
jgi:spore maturation protein B